MANANAKAAAPQQKAAPKQKVDPTTKLPNQKKQAPAPAKAPKEAPKQAAARPSTASLVPGWSAEQQTALEKGMKDFTTKEFPGKVRWEKIAEAVDDKTPKECFERFKEICAKIKAE